MTTLLVASVPLRAEGPEKELSRAASADVIELRVDGVPSADLELLRKLREKLGRPFLLTCRSKREGGDWEGSEEDRLALLGRAVELGFDYVDIEIEALSRAVGPFGNRSAGTKLVLSHHDFERIPADLPARIDRALSLGADVVKIAARVTSLEGSLLLADLGSRVRAAGKRFAFVPLGAEGASGRILAARLGSALAYASLDPTRPTGPGQWPLDVLLDLYRFPEIDEATEIYGVVGRSALESLSPAMHNRFFRRIGKNAVYVPFQERELAPFLRAARKIPIAGLSVTTPFKEEILESLDEVDSQAAAIGAVNTVVMRDRRWKGYNTDVQGVLEPLARFGPLGGRRAVVVGAGGAARAAVHALVREGASVVVLGRSESRARSLAEHAGAESGPLSRLDEVSFDVLVNATPASPVPVAIPETSIVFDMVTAPETTPLLRKAREAGAATVSGLEMLASQAVQQERLWTGEGGDARDFLADARREAASSGQRYSRQILFSGIGASGQSRIRASSVLVVGAGALGSIAAEMLVRAGVGKLRLVDRDYLDESNLQRQSLYDEQDLAEGLPKAVAARRKLQRINGEVAVEASVEDVHAGNVLSLVKGMDLILDGTDNFETRYLLNDASVRSGVPWIYAACVGSYGMSFAVLPGETPCLRCLLEEEPPPGTSPTCDTAGVIAPAVHAVAAFQVAEALKILSGRKEALTGALYSVDVWSGRADSFRPRTKREECPACGRGELVYLKGASESQAVSLCGRNAVQVRPARPLALALEEVGRRWRELAEGAVTMNDYLLRARLSGKDVVLFADGRAIVHGTEDPAEARSLYARYIGT